MALLHGTEAVVPLPDGRSIPVTVKNEGMLANGLNSVNNKEVLEEIKLLNINILRLVEHAHDQVKLGRGTVRALEDQRSIL
jgi:hypothetical protein